MAENSASYQQKIHIKTIFKKDFYVDIVDKFVKKTVFFDLFRIYKGFADFVNVSSPHSY